MFRGRASVVILAASGGAEGSRKMQSCDSACTFGTTLHRDRRLRHCRIEVSTTSLFTSSSPLSGSPEIAAYSLLLLNKP